MTETRPTKQWATSDYESTIKTVPTISRCGTRYRVLGRVLPQPSVLSLRGQLNGVTLDLGLAVYRRHE